ncbi:MAG: aspartate aminotransferase family protein [Rhodospirillales bacterium]|nr:aspartate aminotransferase family protein [Rhodospirillales bacterium]
MDHRGNSAVSRDIAYHLHPYTNLKTHERDGSLIISRGKGVRVFDENGKGYIEAISGLWCTALGFGEKRLVEAATRAMRELPFYHSFHAKAPAVLADLSEKLIGLAPVPMSKVFFANSGSEANDTVVKLVWYYNNARGRPDKKKIISRIKAYHGVTVASASLTGLPNNHRDFDLPLPGILHTDCPHYYRFGEAGESEEDFANRCAANLEKMILDEAPETVAAFIAEPVMGGGGVIVPPATYFEKMQTVLKKYDVLMVADEVICGFGRTGNVWGCQTFGIEPDIMTMAKALTSAYLPMSAVMITDDIYQGLVDESEKIGTFAHGFTYSGHPVPAAVALETLKIYEERDILGHVRKVAPVFQDGLAQFADHPMVGEVRGIGLIGAIELVKNKETGEPFDPADGVGAYLMDRLVEHGLLSRVIGETMAFAPPLVVTPDEIGEMLGLFTRALDDTEAMARQRGLAVG